MNKRIWFKTFTQYIFDIFLIFENHVINEITADVDSDIELPTINLEQPNTEITENESTNDSESEVEDAPAVNIPRISNSLNKSLSSSSAATNSIKFPSMPAFKVKFNSLVKKYIPNICNICNDASVNKYYLYKESCSFKLQLDTFLLDKINSSLCYNFLDKFYG